MGLKDTDLKKDLDVLFIFAPINQPGKKNPFTKISIPIAIRMIPPVIPAFPVNFSPSFFPATAPIKEIAKVTRPIIKQHAKAEISL